jgi:hypothetical protein
MAWYPVICIAEVGWGSRIWSRVLPIICCGRTTYAREQRRACGYGEKSTALVAEECVCLTYIKKGEVLKHGHELIRSEFNIVFRNTAQGTYGVVSAAETIFLVGVFAMSFTMMMQCNRLRGPWELLEVMVQCCIESRRFFFLFKR